MAVVKKKKPLSKTAKKKREALKKRTLTYRLDYSTRGAPKKVYKIAPSQVDDEILKLLVKSANERLRQIEKKGLTRESREYQLVKRYAEEYPEGRGAIYNINKKTGAIRFSRDIAKFITSDVAFSSQGERRAYMINTIRNFMTAETSTIRGIRDLQKRSFENFKYETVNGKKVAKERYKDLTLEQYTRFWKAYRDNVSDSKKDHYGYDAIMTLTLSGNNLMLMDEDQMVEALQTIESTREVDNNPWVAVENVQNLYGVTPAFN